MVRLPPQCGLVNFFFNDTATTEIYTLSLHDALPICAGSGDDAGAEKFGDLNGGAADSAACSENKNILAGLEFSSRKKHVPGGLENKRNRSGLFEAKIFGVRQAIYLGRAHGFGAASVNHVAQVSGLAAVVIKAGHASRALATANQWRENNFQADAHGGNVGADLSNFAGNVAAGNVRKWDVHARDAAANPEVEM